MQKESQNFLHFQHNGADMLSVPARLEYFPQFEDWLDEICDTLNVAPKIRSSLQIALDEIVTNICSYAYQGQSVVGTVSLACSFDTTQSTLELVFADQGVAFNPLQLQETPVAKTIRKGGFGLLMVQKIADALKYERRDNQNVLTLSKKLQ